MTFEEQLARAFDTLTERLRGEIDHHVQRTSAELVAAAPYDRDPAAIEAARQELERAVAAVKRESDEALEAARRDADGALAAARRESDDALEAAQRESRDALETAREESHAALEAVRRESHEALAAARQQADDALAMAQHTSHEKGFAAGHAAGRDEALREAAEANVPAPADADLGRLADAMRAIDAARSLTEILDTLVTVASGDASGVELWLLRGGQLHGWQPTGADRGQATAVRSVEGGGPIAEAASRNTIVRDEQVQAVPIAVEGQVVAVICANREPRTGYLEVLVRYAAKCLEALTASKTVRALRRGSATAADASLVEAGAASVEEDTAARRYARLLISEIKLYHEPAVVDGRRDRDLATRLGGEIARARVMYEQRVAPHVRARADYFHDELVRTLADGDASLLEVRT